MMRRISLSSFLSTATIVCAILFFLGLRGIWLRREENTDKKHYLPDNAVRQCFLNIDPSAIDAIRLRGLNMGFTDDKSQDITDAGVVASFVDALRHAETTDDEPVTDRSESFEVFFKDSNIPPLLYNIKTSIPCESFGRPFREALVVLGKYRAGQLRTILRERSNRLKKITLQSDGGCDVATKAFQSPEELKTLTAEFNTLDENAFAYANMDRSLGVQFTFDDGKKKNVYLILHDWDYLDADKRPKPWPPLINAYLQQIKKQCRH